VSERDHEEKEEEEDSDSIGYPGWSLASSVSSVLVLGLLRRNATQRRSSDTMQSQNQQLKSFWAEQMQEVKEVPVDTSVFKNHQLPLARIKKIMKSDEDVRMISAEAPVLFAKACELFILELTLRSWMHSEESKRRTLQRNDIAAAITKTDVFDFLLDIVPRDDVKDESRMPVGGPVPGHGMYPGMPYQYMHGMAGGEGYQINPAMQQQMYGQYSVPGQFQPITGVQQDKEQ